MEDNKGFFVETAAQIITRLEQNVKHLELSKRALRDTIAIAAMQANLGNQPYMDRLSNEHVVHLEDQYQEISKDAYDIADSMMKAREF